MAEEDDSDKQFEPSQKKLDDARKKGEIAKSTDLIAAGSYAGFIICAVALGPQLMKGFGQSMSMLLEQSHQLADTAFRSDQTTLMGSVISATLLTNVAWFLLPMAVAILVIFAQRAFVFAPTKLVLALSRSVSCPRS